MIALTLSHSNITDAVNKTNHWFSLTVKQRKIRLTKNQPEQPMKTIIQCTFAALATLISASYASAQTSFVLSTNYIVGNGAACVATGDINGDGKVDLIAGSTGGKT